MVALWRGGDRGREGGGGEGEGIEGGRKREGRGGEGIEGGREGGRGERERCSNRWAFAEDAVVVLDINTL